MGCVFTRLCDKQIKQQFQDVWLKFRNSELADRQNFINSKPKVFNYFYYSTCKIYLTKIRRQISYILAKNNNKNLSKPITKDEALMLINNLIEESKKVNQGYDEMIKKLKNYGITSLSRILSENRESGEPWEDLISNVVKISSIKKCDCWTSMKNTLLNVHHEQKGKLSSFHQLIRDSAIRPDESYLIPQDIDSLGEGREDSPFEGKKNRQISEKDATSLCMQRDDMVKELQRSKASNKELIEECLLKQEKIEELKAQIRSIKQQRPQKEVHNDDKWRLQSQALKLQIEHYKQQLQRIAHQKDQLSLSSKIMEKRYEDLNTKSTIIIQAAKKSQAFKISNIIEEIIEPALKENRKEMKEESKPVQGPYQHRDHMYEVILRLFPSSRLIPDYRFLQKAVEIRTTISNMFSTRPLHSDLLYRYDPINPLHYNSYIQNKQNLLMLVRMENDLLLGAFSGAFSENKEVEQSFLFSISSSRGAMKLTPSRRIKRIDLDFAFLNFGMGELRIKAKTLSLTTAIGSFQSIFSWEGKEVPFERFMGTVEKNLTMKGYQIYQIFYEENSVSC